MSGISRLEGKGAGCYGVDEGGTSPALGKGLGSFQRAKLMSLEIASQGDDYERDHLKSMVDDFRSKHGHQMNESDQSRVLTLLGRVSAPSMKDLLSENDLLETVYDAEQLKEKTEQFLSQKREIFEPKSANLCRNIIDSCEDFMSERSGRSSPTKGILIRSHWAWNTEKTRLKAPSPSQLRQINMNQAARNFRSRSGSVTGIEKEALKLEINQFMKEEGENLSKVAVGFIADAMRNLEEG